MSLPWMHLLRHLLDGMEAEWPADDASGVASPHPRQAITDALEEELEL